MNYPPSPNETSAADAFALIVLLLWSLSVIAAGILGATWRATLRNAVLGAFLGPLGVMLCLWLRRAGIAIALIAAMPALAQPSTPSLATATDRIVAEAVVSWGPPNAYGYVTGGSIGLGRGYHELRAGWSLRNVSGAKIAGDANTHVWDSDGGLALDMTGARNCTLRDMTLEARGAGGVALRLDRRPDNASAGGDPESARTVRFGSVRTNRAPLGHG